ncbi:MAG TPA: AmmeMemoRadiSam system protein B [Patescibacteria group bacterium]
MLCFSAIVPHSPLLIPAIGQENIEKFKTTIKALDDLKKKFEEAKPDTVVVISPHGPLLADAFTINLNSDYLGSFEEFGEFATKLEFKPDQQLLSQIRERSTKELPIVLTSNQKLDYGTAVPLFYLTANQPILPIVPVGYSNLNFQKHYQFGQIMSEEVSKIGRRRVAVIASSDLSHSLTEDAPGGYNLKGKEFDQKLLTLLKDNTFEEITKIDPELSKDAAECGLRSIIILLGVLTEKKPKFEEISYEAPFGVGHLVGQFT